MKNIAFMISVISLITLNACVATSKKHQELEDHLHSVLQHQEKQNETQRQMQSHLRKLEKNLEAANKKLSTEIEYQVDAIPFIRSEISNQVEYQSSEINAMMEAQEIIELSLNDIARSEKENSQKIAEIHRDLENLEKTFQKLNFQKDVKTKQHSKELKAERFELFQNVSPEYLYEEAVEAFEKLDYQKALHLWTKITHHFPEHKSVPNAYFWQGEACYQMQDFDNAIHKYNKVIEKHAESNKYPAALLKQGLTYYAINKHREGRMRLKELLEKFPDRDEAKRAEIFLNNR